MRRRSPAEGEQSRENGKGEDDEQGGHGKSRNLGMKVHMAPSTILTISLGLGAGKRRNYNRVRSILISGEPVVTGDGDGRNEKEKLIIGSQTKLRPFCSPVLASPLSCSL